MKRLGFLTVLPLLLSSCESVVPAAWCYFKNSDGFIEMTSYAGSTHHGHINLYLNEEDVGDHDEYDLSIVFYPRQLGNEERELEDGTTVRTMLVDIGKYCEISLTVYTKNGYYSPDKNFYVNGEVQTPYYTYNDSEYFKNFMYKDLPLERGNPGGRMNNKINVLEYK